ncbi:spermidine synthase [Candidatus Omnitrophota bacterium]
MLLSYPFCFELFLTLDQQIVIWRWAYAVVIILQFIAVRLIKVKPVEMRKEEAGEKIEKNVLYSWFLFGAGATMMFLSVNNIITAEIDPLPLLWIVTLSIYLLAFVFNFKRKPWCPKWIVSKIHIILGWSVVLYFLLRQNELPVCASLNLFCLTLFLLCMYCQNRVYQSRPKNDAHLTKFYVVISLGSFIGGFIVSWIIPLVSISFIEYLLGLCVIAWAMLIKGKKVKLEFTDGLCIAFSLFILAIWPKIFPEYNLMGILLLLVLIAFIFSWLARNRRVLAFSLVAILCFSPFFEYLWYKKDFVYRKRNYYGSIEIYDTDELRIFRHGTTHHGAQFLAQDLRREPIFYYTRLSPIGRLLTTDLFDIQRVGVVGLGTGTLATYMNQGQAMDFFEIDPNVNEVARKYYSFIEDSPGDINVILGDARLSIDQMPEKYYDLIVMDAFSGDYIPVHLLTQEAIAKYRRHLKDDGIIVFHVSNRYFNIAPILASTGFTMNARVGVRLGASGRYSYRSTWAVMTWDEGVFKRLQEDLKWTEITKEMVKNWRPWTDGYSTVIPILFDDMLKKMKR